MVRSIAAMLLVLTASAVSVAPAHACSCVQSAGLREAVTSAELAFVGTAIGERPAGKDRTGFGPLIGTTFRVERASSETAPRLEVAARPGEDEGACGFSFGLHERWLVMAHRSGGLLQTSSCAENRSLGAIAPAELALLDELLPHVTVAADREPGDAGTAWLPAVAAAAAAMLAIGLFAAAAFRRSRAVPRTGPR
jgi:hypothetical protein